MMERSQVAEFVLSYVLPAERAAAVTGDFLEEAEARGHVWFWSSVVRTVVSRVASDLRERPFAMMRIGLAGAARSGACVFVLYAASSVLDLFGKSVLMWQLAWTMNIVWALWLFYSGRWVARNMAGAEVASGIAVAFAGWVMLLSWVIFWRVRGIPMDPSGMAWHDLPLIAGVIAQRRRRMAYGS